MSRSEFKALFKRAARGANVPLSQGEEAAAVIASQTNQDFEAVLALFVEALNAPRSKPIAEKTDDVWSIGGDAIQSVPAAIDLAQSGEKVRHEPTPILALWLEFRSMALDKNGLIVDAQKRDISTGHISYSTDLWAQIDALAARTYVPSTEESRQGAGAGNIDND